MKIFFIEIIIRTTLFIACTSFESAPIEAPTQSTVVYINQPPVIKELLFKTTNVSVCDSINFTCTAEDPDNDSLKYEWYSYKLIDTDNSKTLKIFQTEYNGTFKEIGSKTTWLPGALKGKYIIIVKVTDPAGYEAIKDVVVNAYHELCDNIHLVFDIKKIGTFEIEEYSKARGIAPKTIILSSFSYFDFAGIVQFDSIGTRNILSYPIELEYSNAFFIDCSDIYIQGTIVFSELEIQNSYMQGKWAVTSPLIDVSFLPFKAERK